MHISPILALLAVGLLTWLAGNLWRHHRPGARFHAQPRPLVDEAEREMFGQLRAAWTEGVVLAKVSLAALVKVPMHERENLRHRHVDFVLCDDALRVVAVVQLRVSEELQSFQVGESTKVMLEAAGYPVLAWDTPPGAAALREALRPVRRSGPRVLRDDPYAPRPSAD